MTIGSLLRGKTLRKLHWLLQEIRWENKHLRVFNEILESERQPAMINKQTVAVMLTEGQMKMFSFTLIVKTLLFIFDKSLTRVSKSTKEVQDVQLQYGRAAKLILRNGIADIYRKAFPSVLTRFCQLSLSTNIMFKKLVGLSYEHFLIKKTKRKPGWSADDLEHLITACAHVRHVGHLISLGKHVEGMPKSPIESQRLYVSLFNGYIISGVKDVDPDVILHNIRPWELCLGRQLIVHKAMVEKNMLATNRITEGFEKYGKTPAAYESQHIIAALIPLLFTIKSFCFTHIGRLISWIDQHATTDCVIKLTSTLSLQSVKSLDIIIPLYNSRIAPLLDSTTLSASNCVRCFIIVSELCSKAMIPINFINKKFLMDVLQAAYLDPVGWFRNFNQKDRIDFVYCMKSQLHTPSNVRLIRSLEVIIRTESRWTSSDTIYFYRLIVSLSHYKIDVLPYAPNFREFLKKKYFFRKSSSLLRLEREFSKTIEPSQQRRHRVENNRTLAEAWAVVWLNEPALT